MDALKNTCGSCKNRYIPSVQEPCNSCSNNEFVPLLERGGRNKWEPSIDFVEKKAAEEIAKDLGPVVSDGGSTSYYDLPEGASELNDLIEHKKMPFALGNIFKACYRLGEKSGTDAAYDVRKMIFFANRILKQLEKTNA